MARTDLILDENYDVQFDASGNLLTGNSDGQHIELLLATATGEWKENPQVGVGIHKEKLSSIDGTLKRTIYVQLEADKYNVNDVVITETNISIDAQLV
jgi:hypothetical protein